MRKLSNGCEVQALEQRRLLSAAADAVPQAVIDAGADAVQWHGKTIYAQPGRWIVQMDGVVGTPEAQLRRAGEQLGRADPSIAPVRRLGRDGLFLVQAPPDAAPDRLERSLMRMGNVRHVEPDAIVWGAGLSNDPALGQLWGLHNTGQSGGTPDADIDAPEAWDITTGSAGVVVGVIDSGIDYKHPDLAANAWVNDAELNGRKNFDDDGNGYKDDVYGYDFINRDGDPMDDNGHGTHVAGTIAAAGDNGVGVAGVSWTAKVMALKFLAANNSGPISAAIEAIHYATMMKQRGVNLRLTNNSYQYFDYSQALDDAVRDNAAAGMLFVAAAGNNVHAPMWPARLLHDNMITVAATDRNDAIASFSVFSTAEVELAAPGVDVYSTQPRGTYGLKSGTSMATPHVVGTAALAWAHRPDATAAQVRAAILTGVDPVAGLAARVGTGGRLNAFGALSRIDATYADPSVPTGLTAVATVSTGGTSYRVDLAWEPVAHADVEGYNVYRSVAGGPFVRVANVAASSTTYRDSSLLPGTAYGYRITARNFLSVESAASDVAEATTPGEPLTIPAAPSNLVATAASRTAVNLSWTDNSTNEQAFSIERSQDGSTWTQVNSVGANVTSYSDGNLKRNVRYYYRVRAHNAAGYSEYSNVASAVTSGASSTATASPAATTRPGVVVGGALGGVGVTGGWKVRAPEDSLAKRIFSDVPM